MPYVKRYRKKKPFKKKTFRRRKAGVKRRNYLIPKNPQYTPGSVIKRTQRVNLCYNDGGMPMESVSGGAIGFLYRLNSIFDPYYATGGHQPMGHDQWANLYQNYRVLGAKITARFYWDHAATVGNSHNCGITILSPNQTAQISDQSQLFERTHARQIKLLKSNSRDSQFVTAYWSAKKYFGKILAYDHTATAQMDANPTYPALAQVWVGTSDRSSSSSEPVKIDVTIDYLVELSEPVSLATS